MKNISKIGYVVLMIIIIALVVSIPAIYDELNKQNVKEVSTEVTLALNSPDIATELNELGEDYEFMIVVQSSDFYYSTFNSKVENIDELELSSDFYQIVDDENGYNYVLYIPPISFDTFYIYILFILLVITLLIVIWNILFVRFVIRLIVKPMTTLKYNINNLRNYDFIEVENDTKDKINDELLQFSEDLNGVLDQYNIKISEKEQDYFEQIVLADKKEQYLTTVIHDFKGELDNIKAGTVDLKTQKSLDDLKNKTEQSIKVAVSKNALSLNTTQNINLKSYLFNIVNSKRDIMDQKEIFVNFYVIDYYVEENEIILNQLFTNIISNAIKHTERFGQIDIELKEETLYIKNDCSENVDFERIFKLDYSSKNNSKVGYGMYRIKQIIEEIDWDLEVYNEEGKFVVEIYIGDLDE